ncbi:macro domain-containing protein [Thomasclavelia spiroformis]|uniref:macro domain-containing protein n=1 Tax=Thomasclavelia spiroformis TaxID=29348 RepID=UPI00241F2140|nr:macro domain-containing protein [Thomasclavelia spiroformis]
MNYQHLTEVKLKAKYIIHAVGPIYRDGKHGEREILEAAYRNSLLLAKQYKLRSIAFPLISSGIYGYPYNEALEVAKETINKFLIDNDIDVYLVLYR